MAMTVGDPRSPMARPRARGELGFPASPPPLDDEEQYQLVPEQQGNGTPWPTEYAPDREEDIYTAMARMPRLAASAAPTSLTDAVVERRKRLVPFRQFLAMLESRKLASKAAKDAAVDGFLRENFKISRQWAIENGYLNEDNTPTEKGREALDKKPAEIRERAAAILSPEAKQSPALASFRPEGAVRDRLVEFLDRSSVAAPPGPSGPGEGIRAWNPMRDEPFTGDVRLGIMPGLPAGAGAFVSRLLNAIARRPAPASYLGYQEGFGGRPGFHLYNLTQDIPGHPAGSTVTENTLRALGYRLPPPPAR